MSDIKLRAEEAKNYIHILSHEIGPRPAASPAETSARETIVARMTSWGYSVNEQDFSFAPEASFPWLSILICGLLITFGWIIRVFPEISIFLPVIYLFLPSLIRLEARFRRKTAHSKNLFCTHPGQDGSDLPLFIISAHLDTARAFVMKQRFWLVIYSKYMTILQRTAMLIAILSFFTLLNVNIPPFLYWAVGGLGSIVGVVFLALDVINTVFPGAVYSPGAVDNASGVGAAMALAHYYAEYLPKRLRIGFLFTSAEETGMHGAEAFAQWVKAKEKNRVGVINLDMVGAGQNLCVVTKAGLLPTLATDRLFNELLSDIHPSILPVQYTLRGGDFEAYSRHRISSTSLETRGAKSAELAYHTINDTVEQIELLSLETTINVVTQFIERLPYTRWASKPQK